MAQCCVLPCSTDPFHSPVNDISTKPKAISVYFPNLLNCIHVVKTIWKLQTVCVNVAAVLSGDLGSWVLEIAQLLCCDLCRQLQMSYGHILEDTFVFARRVTKRQQLGNLKWKPESPGLRMKVMLRQNRWRWDGYVFWLVASPIFDALFCCT